VVKFICSFFSCCHNYNNGRFEFFFLVAISIIGGEIYLHFFNSAMMKSNRSLTKDEILIFLGLLVLQAACPKTYKSTVTNSFEIVVNLLM
jgi:hypothetical protein